MIERNVDGLGGTAEIGCGKELGVLGSTPKDRVPREFRWVGRGTPAGRLLQD